MAAMTEDSIFEASAGVSVKGTVYGGQRQIRKGVESVFIQFPDARWSEPKHFIAGRQRRDRMGLLRHTGGRRARRGSGVRCLHVRGPQDRREELLPKAAERLLTGRSGGRG